MPALKSFQGLNEQQTQGFSGLQQAESPQGIAAPAGIEQDIFVQGLGKAIEFMEQPEVQEMAGPMAGEAALSLTLGSIPIAGQASFAVRLGTMALRLLAPGIGAGLGSIASDIALNKEMDVNRAGIEALLSSTPTFLFEFTPDVIKMFRRGRPLAADKAISIVNSSIQESFDSPVIGDAGRIFDDVDTAVEKIKVVPGDVLQEFGDIFKDPDVLKDTIDALEQIDRKFRLPKDPKSGMRPFQKLFDSMVKGRFTADTSIGQLRQAEQMLGPLAAQFKKGNPKRDALLAFKRTINRSLDSALKKGEMGAVGEKIRKARRLHDREVAASEMMLLVGSNMTPITKGEFGVAINLGQLVKDIALEDDLLRRGVKKALNPTARAVVERMRRLVDDQGRQIGMEGFREFKRVVEQLPDPGRVRVDSVTALFAVAAFTGNATAIGVGLASGIGSALVSDSGLRIITNMIQKNGRLSMKALGFAINAARRETIGVGEIPKEELAIDLDAVKDFFGGLR